MAYDVHDIAQALVASLSDLQADGVDVQAVPMIPANPKPPGVYISDGPITYDRAMHRGLDEIEMHVTLLVAHGADLPAQRRLRKLRDGAGGVKALIETDKTLGGLVDHARVTKVSPPRLYGEAAGKPALGCEFTVQISATP